MQIKLTPDQEVFARQAIASGRISSEEDVVREALAIWEERERTREEIRATLDQAEASLAGGEGLPITDESMSTLATAVHQRGLERLRAKHPSAK